jgi:AraC family transcriptional regulator
MNTMHPPTLTTTPPRRLVGIRIQTTLAENRAAELWRRFRPRVAEIHNRLGADFFDVKRYGPEMTNGQFSPTTVFEKWAAVEVEGLWPTPRRACQPLERARRTLCGVRPPRPGHGEFRPTRTSTFSAPGCPLPGYRLDERPHFDVMGPGYRPDDPEATEEVWVPVIPI